MQGLNPVGPRSAISVAIPAMRPLSRSSRKCWPASRGIRRKLPRARERRHLLPPRRKAWESLKLLPSRPSIPLKRGSSQSGNPGLKGESPRPGDPHDSGSDAPPESAAPPARAPEEPRLFPRRIAQLFHEFGSVRQEIEQTRFSLPEANGKEVGKWNHEGREILYGTEPWEDTAYWNSLAAFASRRAEVRNTLLPDDGPDAVSAVKLAVILTESDRDSVQTALPSAESPSGYIDLIELNPGEARELAALCDQIENGQAPPPTALPNFWERFLRPRPRAL